MQGYLQLRRFNMDKYKTEKLLLDLDDNKKNIEPARNVGMVFSVLIAISEFIIFIPDLSEATKANIYMIIAILAPIVTAFTTRNKVWSPATVNTLVNEVSKRATEAAMTVANRNKLRLAQQETSPKEDKESRYQLPD